MITATLPVTEHTFQNSCRLVKLSKVTRKFYDFDNDFFKFLIRKKNQLLLHKVG